MSWIHGDSADPPGGPARGLLEQIRARSHRGQVAHLWQTLASDPPVLEALHGLYRTLMEDPVPLTRAQAEMIAVVVSATNGCGYAVAHHGPQLARALGSEALARAVAMDYRAADLTARDRVLLDACVALTCEPSERTRADVERVREYGFDDPAILRATAITAFFNLTNRIVQGLGIALETWYEPWEFGAQR
jgi:uncharacterized peroxidase-related enzyme